MKKILLLAGLVLVRIVGVGSLGKVVSEASGLYVLTVQYMYKRTVNSTVQYRE